MLHTLTAQQLMTKIQPESLRFHDTSELAELAGGQGASKAWPSNQRSGEQWIGQAEAEKAARFGLSMKQPGFHLLVLGEHGSGRTSLMLNLMQELSQARTKSPDLVLIYNFESPEKPSSLYLVAGKGAELRTHMDGYIRQLAKTLMPMLNGGAPVESKAKAAAKPKLPDTAMPDNTISAAIKLAAQDWITVELSKLETFAADIFAADQADAQSIFAAYLNGLKQDIADNLELLAAGMNADNEGLLESFLARYRVNLLVDNRAGVGAPVIYDDDPSFQSLFGGYESSNDNAGSSADFMRLRAGNLLRAHGGMLMLQLRDIQADQQNGSQIMEKLHRVLRNRRVQIEESGAASGSGSTGHFAPESLLLDVKLVLIASREEYYELHDELPDFAQYFSIKVDFSERFIANDESYSYVARYIALQCAKHKLMHFTAGAVARLIQVMQRRIDDQGRISANFGYLQGLIFESAVLAGLRQASLVAVEDVVDAISARIKRYQQPEQQLAEAIADGELTISVHGKAIGQINGLTHIDLGDACFGSPVRISARCYAGDEGVINIDREVEMTGPNHDKGLFILRSWLSSSFIHLTPLSLSASLVFEQEYHGVEGDSASCAELYCLLSALSSQPILQGLAVTGAMNQHGEVMAIGGVNEKIEGYFRICKRLGLDGKQGVLIPSRNISHLLLDDDVIEAVEQGQFHIYAADTVQDGIALLTDVVAGQMDAQGNYEASSLLATVEQKLKQLRDAYAVNRVTRLS